MTSDAKIGLLLGLVFIFIIAFIINGLPNFHEDRNNSELTTNMAGLRNSPSGLAAKERKATREVVNQMPAKKQPLQIVSPSTGNQNIRFTSQLPGNVSVENRRESREVESSKPPLVKVYVVKEGDSLAVIAKKLYGSENGNKRTSIAGLFKANRSVLKSPDEIYVGQRLAIPALSASSSSKSRIGNVLASPMLEKIESIGRRHLSSAGRKAARGGRYVVREGDSLWRIAAERLGDGSRYNE